MKDHRPSLVCVDEDPELLRTLKRYFTHQGFVVHTTTNGVEALLQLKQWSPKAVILNLFMPRLGGIETLESIRRLNPGIVIILITRGLNALEMVTEAGVSVASAFTKPVDPAEISEALAKAGVAPRRTRGAAPGEPSPEGWPLPRNRVLVVDDQPDFREMLATYLHGNGLETLQARDGQEALRRIRDFRPHVVLLDIWMPGLNGVETLRRIKALPQKTYVVMVSAVEHEEQARRTLALGASDYLCKPVDFGYLDAVLETFLLLAQLDPASE